MRLRYTSQRFLSSNQMHRNIFACSCTARCLAFVLTAVLVPSLVFAQTPQVPTFTVGKLDAVGRRSRDRRPRQRARSGRPSSRTRRSRSRIPIEGAPATEKTEVRLIVGKGNVYVGIICFDSDPSKIIVSQARRDASLNDTDSVIMVFDTFNDNQNAFVFGTNPLGIEYDGQVAREGQTSGVSLGGGGAGGTQRGGISAFNPNWDGDWTVQVADHRARLGSRDGDPAEDAALPDRHRPDLGLQRPAQHPPQERAGLSRADSARLRHLPRLAGREDVGPRPAAAPRHQADSVRARLGEQGLHARRAIRSTRTATSAST